MGRPQAPLLQMRVGHARFPFNASAFCVSGLQLDVGLFWMPLPSGWYGRVQCSFFGTIGNPIFADNVNQKGG
jgi:hypothetical protein